mmetsp:Transcript_22663/g.57409  ORF Transcript_22663/g.57409 Transcript_22663/m.57409 type:complete len:451 (-) Transcript_22663:388-1740(-)
MQEKATGTRNQTKKCVRCSGEIASMKGAVLLLQRVMSRQVDLADYRADAEMHKLVKLLKEEVATASAGATSSTTSARATQLDCTAYSARNVLVNAIAQSVATVENVVAEVQRKLAAQDQLIRQLQADMRDVKAAVAASGSVAVPSRASRLDPLQQPGAGGFLVAGDGATEDPSAGVVGRLASGLHERLFGGAGEDESKVGEGRASFWSSNLHLSAGAGAGPLALDEGSNSVAPPVPVSKSPEMVKHLQQKHELRVRAASGANKPPAAGGQNFDLIGGPSTAGNSPTGRAAESPTTSKTGGRQLQEGARVLDEGDRDSTRQIEIPFPSAGPPPPAATYMHPEPPTTVLNGFDRDEMLREARERRKSTSTATTYYESVAAFGSSVANVLSGRWADGGAKATPRNPNPGTEEGREEKLVLLSPERIITRTDDSDEGGGKIDLPHKELFSLKKE